MKRFLNYFVWTLVVGLVLYFGMQLQEQLIERSQMTFNPFPAQVYIAVFPVIIGLLIRIPKFILYTKEREYWTYDWVKFTAIGLPTLYIVLMTFLPFSTLGEGWLPLLPFPYYAETTVPTVAGLVFGYILLASFKSTDASKTETTI